MPVISHYVSDYSKYLNIYLKLRCIIVLNFLFAFFLFFFQVTVIDTSDPDWWKGKVLGRVGYFPSKYCVRLNANEKPLQVTHNLQVSDGERGENMTLLRDQIVIQVSLLKKPLNISLCFNSIQLQFP